MAAFELYLNMAGFRWRVEAPYELEISDNYLPFICPPCTPDCEYVFEFGRPERGAMMIEEPRFCVWRTANACFMERIPILANLPCACICAPDADPRHVRGWIYPERQGSVRTLSNLFDVGCLENMLTTFDAINLHSSFIRVNDCAILFTAPSGTGKSTQADLWEQYTDAEQINGDRSVIRCVDGVWTAFGFPYAGSSGIFRNEAVPIRAVVVLRQAPENTIEQLRPSEAFRLLYSETAIQRWHDQGHTRIVDQLLTMCRSIPVYKLCCTPDERAVRLLQKTLSTEESI